LKILLVSSSFFPKIDGSTRCVYDHARGLAAEGNIVYLITRGIEGARRAENLEGIRIRRTSVSFRSGTPLNRLLMVLEQAVSIMVLNRRVRFDVIHAHGYSSGFAALLCRYVYRVPLIITTHGTELLWPKQLWWKSETEIKLGLLFETFVLEHCDIVIAQSDGVKQYMLRIYSPDLESKIRIVHTGVDHRKFQPPSRVIPSRVILFVGALSEIKGVAGLIDSFAQVHREIPESKLVLVGAGPRGGYYREYVDKLGLRDSVRFEGAVRDDARLARLYSDSDIVVLPSNVGGPISCTIMEGLSCGRAVISTNVPGGIPDVLDGGVGLLIERGDWNTLTEDLRRLLTDGEFLSMTERHARTAVEEKYTLDSMISKLTEVYMEGSR
jgi:glycosyltransferase involved in cell wall biosynthesis